MKPNAYLRDIVHRCKDKLEQRIVVRASFFKSTSSLVVEIALIRFRGTAESGIEGGGREGGGEKQVLGV